MPALGPSGRRGTSRPPDAMGARPGGGPGGRPGGGEPGVGRGATGASPTAGVAGTDTTGACNGALGAGVDTAGASSGALGAGVDTAGASSGEPDAGAGGLAAGVSTTIAGVGAAALAVLGGSGSSSGGWWSRISPSRSARRRTRSACASTTLDEWLLSPIPSASQRSSVSLLVRPSSRASSYSRIFAGKCSLSPSGLSIGRHGCRPRDTRGQATRER